MFGSHGKHGVGVQPLGEEARSCPQLQLTPRWTHGRSESIWDTGGASVKTQIRTGNKVPNSPERGGAQRAEINPWMEHISVTSEYGPAPHNPALCDHWHSAACQKRMYDIGEV